MHGSVLLAAQEVSSSGFGSVAVASLILAACIGGIILMRFRLG